MLSKVGIAHEMTRYQAIINALETIKDDIKKKIARKRRVLIKPNLGFINRRLANTQVEAVSALLEFLREFYQRPITIAEGSTVGSTNKAFLEFGYHDFIDKYKIDLVDLNEDSFKSFKIYDGALNKKITIGISETVLHSDFLISICPMKTHDSVVVTLGIKNVVVGAIRKSDRSKIHQGPKAINLTLAELAKKLLPDLVVLDGFEAMEGDGPVYGDLVNFQVAVASLDAVAADSMGALLMGFNPSEIGYLHYCSQYKLGVSDPLRIVNLGTNYKKLVKSFRPHRSYFQQLDWKI